MDELFEEPQKASTETAKCPACGADLVYDPETRGLKCPYCGTEKEIAGTKCSESDLNRLFTERANNWATETKAFRCENCGAQTIISKKEISKCCAYCGASNIIESEEMAGMRPDAVLPFTLTKEDAGKSATAWAKKKFFAPRKFKQSATPENINGNYTPSFTFDSDVHGVYSGRLGKYYYETKIVNGKKRQVRKIRYFEIGGVYDTSFDDVLIQASDKISQKDIDKIQPFDTNSSQKYSANYLYGFSATQYTRDGKTCWNAAKDVMYARTKSRILAKYTYDVIDRFSLNATYNNVTYKYVLLPLYIGHFSFKEKLYNFFVNGRNGKATGKVPISPLKVALVVLAGLAVIAAIVAIYLNGG
ncbi:MAG: hypothetical protein J5781_03065 [Clostridia bacterium]|nr:hypothetical protein [Clostridia bacterium]